MALKLLKVEQEQPSWLKTIPPISDIVKEKPSAGFVKYVESQTQSPEMRSILLSSESEKQKYKAEAAKRRHILTPEEMERGRKALASGVRKQKEDTYVEEQERKHELTLPKESKWDQPKYFKLKSKQNIGISYPKAKKLPIKESYKRTVSSERKLAISIPEFGITKYGKPKRQQVSQAKQIKDFVRDTFTLEKPKPTQRLLKQPEVVKPKPKPKIQPKPVSPVSGSAPRSLFGGLFEAPKPKPQPIVKQPEKKVSHKKRKPVEKKFKIIKKYYRRYPRKCSQR